MSKLFIIAIFACALLLTGCKTQKSGSREYIPGKGWESIQHTPLDSDPAQAG